MGEKKNINVFDYGRPFWAVIGDDNAANVAGASQIVADLLFGPKGMDAQNSFERGKKEFKDELRRVRFESPFTSLGAEMAGEAAFGALGGVVGNALVKNLKILNSLKKVRSPFHKKSTHLRRTPEQWQEDLEYGRREFEKLRKQAPLKREGMPDVHVNRKSWNKIRSGNIREEYDMLQDVPDIYATGSYNGPSPLDKARKDDFQFFHWIQKGNRGIQIGENSEKWVLYNVNPDVKAFLLKHPKKAKKLGIDLSKL